MPCQKACARPVNSLGSLNLSLPYQGSNVCLFCLLSDYCHKMHATQFVSDWESR